MLSHVCAFRIDFPSCETTISNAVATFVDFREIIWISTDSNLAVLRYWSRSFYLTWTRLGIPPVVIICQPDFEISDAFVDAARSLVLIDTLQWPAVYRSYGPGKMAYVAPSLDLAVQFHSSSQDSSWLFCDAFGDYAHRGVIAGNATVWNEQGQLIASGHSQSLCRKID